MENPLNTWFFSTGKIVTDSKIQNVTHFMLDGGKIDLTKDHDIFQELYTKYINCKNCIVERKTDIFKFFIDFDVLSEVIIDIHEYALVIQQIISNIYKNNELICIITGADKNKTVIKNEKEYIKQGFHFHWKDIFVDKQTALIIRNNIIVTLTNVFGKKDEFYDNWEKITGHIKRQIQHTLLEVLDFTFFEKKQIVDLDLRTSGIQKGKKSFLNLEITLFIHNKFVEFKSLILRNKIKTLLTAIYTDDLKNCKFFTLNKTKNPEMVIS